MHLCKKLELELKIIPISKEGILSEDEIINNCDDTTKVLSLTHMSNDFDNESCQICFTDEKILSLRVSKIELSSQTQKLRSSTTKS